MTLGNLIANSIVDDSTEIIIRCEDSFHVIASGKRQENNILNYIDKEIEGFTWEKENIIYVDMLEREIEKGILIDTINIKYEPYPVYVYKNNGFYYTESQNTNYKKLCSIDRDYREELSYSYY